MIRAQRSLNPQLEALLEELAAFDTATLYEAAGQTGMVDPAIRPVWKGARLCGPALTVRSPAGDNLALHHAVTIAAPGEILVASADNYLLAGAWGEVLTVAAQACGIAGLAIDGAVRDSEAIAQRGFPVFSRGVAIGACTKEKYGELNIPLLFGGVKVQPGDIVVGDADGIVILERDRLETTLESARQRRSRELKLITQLQSGKTTLELLDLPRLPASPDGRKP
ncbi:MAG: RraA family protein [Bryobacteraceae bacterium]